MNFIVGLLGLGFTGLLIALIALAPILFIRAAMKRKSELAAVAGQALARIAGPLFDAAPQLRMEAGGMTGVVEGRRSGEPVELKVQYAKSRTTSYTSSFLGTTTVTMGLRGAQPTLSLVQKDKLATYFSDRFSGDVDSPLLDDETKEALMEYAVRVPMVERIEVTKDGITIGLPDSPLQPTPAATESVAKDIERTVLLADVLQKRILRALETRVTEEAHIRVDAYREPGLESSELADDSDEAAKAREA